jgi:hypothetical protein
MQLKKAFGLFWWLKSYDTSLFLFATTKRPVLIKERVSVGE